MAQVNSTHDVARVRRRFPRRCRAALALALALVVAAVSSCRRHGGVEPEDEARPGDAPTAGTSAAVAGATQPGARVVNVFSLPPNHLYPGDRSPLSTTALRPLPPGAIVARGWLRRELEATLAEVRSALDEPAFFARIDTPAPCDELRLSAFRALGLLAFALDDDAARDEALRVVTALLESRDDEGWFGPAALKATLEWGPNAVLLAGLSDLLPATGNPATLDLLAAYLAFQEPRLDAAPIESHSERVGSLAALRAVFNRTGDATLAGAAASIDPRADDTRDPELLALRAVFSGDASYLHAAGALWRDRDTHEADACALARWTDALPGLCELSSDLVWIDRLEGIVFNELPRRRRDGGGVEGPLPQACCRMESARAWPRFAGSLWRACPGAGLVAMSYAPNEVRAVVGDDEGVTVTVRVDTDHPFGGTIRVVVTPARPVPFPLALRIPGWCESAAARVNDGAAIHGRAGTLLGLHRTWTAGDTVTLTLPMPVTIAAATRNSIAVSRGPLRFGLPAGLESPWNIALTLDRFQADRSLLLRPGALERPFVPGTPGVALVARGRAIPEWTDVGATPPQSPILEDRLAGDEREVELVPLAAIEGAAVTTLPWTAR